MKYILTYLGAILFYIASSLSTIWAIVEFILYLVKDKEFNWWSVWLIPITLATAIVLSILPATWRMKEMKQHPSMLKKSKWQTRMEEIQ